MSRTNPQLALELAMSTYKSRDAIFAFAEDLLKWLDKKDERGPLTKVGFTK